MHDPFLKSVFADRRMIEILIRDHAPEWADEIDFSTLREEPTELVSRKTLERRHPDMIWSADTADGGRVVFLVEFQREVERLMALRTTTYTALALERIVGEADIRSEDPLPEFGPLPRRRSLERPNSGGRPLSAVATRPLPLGLVENRGGSGRSAG